MKIPIVVFFWPYGPTRCGGSGGGRRLKATFVHVTLGDENRTPLVVNEERMIDFLHKFVIAIAVFAVGNLAVERTRAGTIPLIIAMSLSSPTDVEFDGASFFVIDDHDGATTGDQDTGVSFTDFMHPIANDIPSATGSFSMIGLSKFGQAVVPAGSNSVLQKFTGGSFSLYDASNNLLLSGNLSLSTVSGTLGISGGGLFLASSVTLTGGSLKSHIDASSFQLSMNFGSIVRNPGQVGLAISPAPSLPLAVPYFGDFVPFTADATVDANAKAIPEPGSLALVALCGAWMSAMRRGRG